MCGEEVHAREVCKELGFTFVSFTDRKVTYRCVCGNEATTHAGNLFRKDRTAKCLKCQNNDNKNDFDEIKKMFEEAGCELLSTEYKNRQVPLKYKCNCGVVSTVRPYDFMRGKRCMKCKPKKYAETCKEKYGVSNMFQLDTVKGKSKETCKKKYGVEHCMQNADVQSRAMATSFHRQKTVAHEGYKWSVLGYENFCIQDLLKKYKPEDIHAGIGFDIPSVNYKYDGKNKVWHPDIYIPSEKILIEVKSSWTYSKCADVMKAKMKAAKMNCELYIYNRDGSVFDTVKRYACNGRLKYLHGKFMLGEPLGTATAVEDDDNSESEN